MGLAEPAPKYEAPGFKAASGQKMRNGVHLAILFPFNTNSNSSTSARVLSSLRFIGLKLFGIY